ncbi:hypothetical protein MmiAt1_17750 [Methanimicrococcus sp. At1]|uniref:SD-repeat containing protein B domain-containing protein n=1 Tax=Methanimicrococcus hacksteinii TaxID=3028293 RepID=A0ABU3VRX6_9EURY|nr:SdrD B-like domain-containing protein [Methanimicrococcus sp. At1]MDV0446157.1 hypothetical protein [Methanimicrococcus sp. At1]
MTKLVEKISFRNIMVLMSAAMILLLLAGSAMAANELSSKWSDGDSSSFELNESRSLIYTIGSLPKGTYELEITLANTDGSYSDSGFEILGYTGSDKIPDTYSNILNKDKIKLSNDKTTLTYTLENPIFMTLDVVIYANGSGVYPNEEVQISAVLKQSGGNPIDTDTTSIDCKIDKVSFSSQMFLLNPAEMPAYFDKTVLVNATYRIAASTEASRTYSTNGLKLPVQGLTVDFSNVEIKYYNGTAMDIKKYSELYETYGDNSPIVFMDESGNTLTNHKLVLGNKANLFSGTSYPFSFKVNGGFVNQGAAPQIIFKNISVSGDILSNGRGPSYQFGSSLVNAVSAPATLTGSENMNVYIYPLAGILPNSIQYDQSNDPRAHLYTQDLFKLQITDSIRDGRDVEITVVLPDGVNITHLRMPKPPAKDNDDIKYKSVSVYNNTSKVYDSLDTYVSVSNTGSYLVDFTDHGFDPVFDEGDDRVMKFKFEKLLKIRLAYSSAGNYASTNGITFIGTTEDVEDSTITVKTTAPGNDVSGSLDLTPDSKYPLSGYIGLKKGELLVNSDGTKISAPLVKGETYVLSSNFTPSGYPYYSSHRTDPLSPSSTYTVSNPVVYFSIPKDFAAGTPTLQHSSTKSGAITDVLGREVVLADPVIYPNAGVYGDEGGRLVEVRMMLAENPVGSLDPQNFWLKTGTYKIDLPITLSLLTTEESVVFTKDSVLVSSWDSGASFFKARDGGNCGNTLTLTSAGIDFSAVSAISDDGIYARYLEDKSFSINTEKVTDVSVYVETASGYVSYNPSNPNSYLQLHAGSKNEVFHMVMKGGTETVESDSVLGSAAYFVIPKGSEWKTVLNGDFVLNTDMAAVEVSYTDFAVDSDKIGTDYDYSYFDSIDENEWTKIDFTPVTGTESKSNLDSVTLNAITMVKCLFVLNDPDEMFDLSMPFEVPRAEEGTTYGGPAALIRGHTAFSFGDPINIAKDDSNTPAIERTKTSAPALKFVDSVDGSELVLSNIPTSFADVRMEDGESSIPNWWNVSVSDDFTDVALSSIKIDFVPAKSGQSRTQPLTPFTPNGAFYEKDATDGLEWNSYTVSDKSFVTLTPGTYTFTYTTAKDDDLQSDTKIVSLTITKDNEIKLSNGKYEAFQDSSKKGTDPIPVFKSFVSGTDDNVPIASTDFVHVPTVGSNDFGVIGWDVPGKYAFTYSYTDIGNNKETADVDVIIKYKGALTLKPVLQAGSEDLIETIVFGVNGDTVDFDGEKYTAELKAASGTPKQVVYTVSLTSYPSGLIKPDTLPSGTAGTDVGDMLPFPSKEVIFTPAQFIVETDGAGVETLTLMKVGAGGDPDEEIETKSIYGTAADTIAFAPEDGEWFKDGAYYMTVTFLPGYGVGASSDFSESGDVFKTASVTLNSEDVEWNCNIEKTPLVSGIAWNDANKDSLMDVGEDVLSDVEVELWYNDGTDWTIVGTTATNDTGYYRFYEDLEEGAYYIKVNVLSGYQLSEFVVGGAQVIHKVNNCSDEFNLDSNDGMWKTDGHIGLYKTENSGNGNGYGQAYVVYSTSGGTILVEGPEGDVIEPGFERPVDVPEEEKGFPWLFLILVIGGILVFFVVFYSEYVKKEQN